jgi:hypothetical protein
LRFIALRYMDLARVPGVRVSVAAGPDAIAR